MNRKGKWLIKNIDIINIQKLNIKEFKNFNHQQTIQTKLYKAAR